MSALPTPINPSISPPTRTSLIGREREVAELQALLVRSDLRLVTLTGSGGVGKTRLAQEVATQVGSAFTDGVTFVDLSPIRDPTLFVSAVAQALGIREIGDRPLLAQLETTLHERHCLLLLDNFEQIVEAAPTVSALLAACPGLHLLVTSRVLLRLSHEQSYPVSPLALPDPHGSAHVDRLAETPAVQLFVAQARMADPRFELTPANAPAVAAICHRLDGLPLALELAAARTRHLQPAALLPRLAQRLPLLTGGPRDVPARLQTMRNAIAWSYDLLEPNEQAVFRWLAVFVGSFSLSAAETVCQTDDQPSDVLTNVATLIDASLIRPVTGSGRFGEHDAEPRFALFETIREFGLGLLQATGEEGTTRDRHAVYFLALAETHEMTLVGPEDDAVLNRVALDYPNLRAALEWFSSRGQSETGLRLASSLASFWARSNFLSEGLTTLEHFLELAETTPRPERAQALMVAGLLARRSAELTRAERLLGDALTTMRSLEPAGHRDIPYVLRELGEVAVNQGDLDRAEEITREAVVLARANDDRLVEAWSLDVLGVVAYARRDYAEAYARFLEVLPIIQSHGDREANLTVFGNLGWVSLAQGNVQQAAKWYLECLTVALNSGTQYGLAWGLDGVAGLAAIQGQGVPAARLFGASEAIRIAGNLPVPPVVRANYARYVDAARQSMDEQRFADAWAEGRALSPILAVEEARAVLTDGSSAASIQPPPVLLAYGITSREAEVLLLLTRRLTDKEIAEELFLSHRTVSSHVTNILAKLGVNSRREAAVRARHEGLA